MSDVLFLNAVPQSPFTSSFRLLSVIILHTRRQYSSSGCKKEELFQYWKYTMRGTTYNVHRGAHEKGAVIKLCYSRVNHKTTNRALSHIEQRTGKSRQSRNNRNSTFSRTRGTASATVPSNRFLKLLP